MAIFQYSSVLNRRSGAYIPFPSCPASSLNSIMSIWLRGACCPRSGLVFLGFVGENDNQTRTRVFAVVSPGAANQSDRVTPWAPKLSLSRTGADSTGKNHVVGVDIRCYHWQDPDCPAADHAQSGWLKSEEIDAWLRRIVDHVGGAVLLLKPPPPPPQQKQFGVVPHPVAPKPSPKAAAPGAPKPSPKAAAPAPPRPSPKAKVGRAVVKRKRVPSSDSDDSDSWFSEFDPDRKRTVSESSLGSKQGSDEDTKEYEDRQTKRAVARWKEPRRKLVAQKAAERKLLNGVRVYERGKRRGSPPDTHKDSTSA